MNIFGLCNAVDHRNRGTTNRIDRDYIVAECKDRVARDEIVGNKKSMNIYS